MSPEERSLLQNTYEMAKENNEILRSLKRSNRLSTILRIGYWALIILFSFGAIYLIQPYLNFLISSLGGGADSGTNISTQIQNILK